MGPTLKQTPFTSFDLSSGGVHPVWQGCWRLLFREAFEAETDHGSGIWDPHFDMLDSGPVRTDCRVIGLGRFWYGLLHARACPLCETHLLAIRLWTLSQCLSVLNMVVSMDVRIPIWFWTRRTQAYVQMHYSTDTFKCALGLGGRKSMRFVLFTPPLVCFMLEARFVRVRLQANRAREGWDLCQRLGNPAEAFRTTMAGSVQRCSVADPLLHTCI